MFRFLVLFPQWLVGDSLRSQQTALLRLLAVSHSQRIDPRRMVANLAEEHTGSYRRTLLRLGRWLDAGSSMASALRHAPGALSEEDTLAIQCGIENERLSETFEHLLNSERYEEDFDSQHEIGKAIAYVGVTSIFALTVISFLMIFIVPTFEMIFEEFEMQMPVSMLALIDFSNDFGSFMPLAVLLVIVVGIAVQFEDFRRRFRHTFLMRMMPGNRAQKRAGILALLALPTEIEQPLSATLTSAALYHADPNIRRRLLDARTSIDREEAVFDQLARHGLLSTNEAEQLPRIESPRLRAWCLKTLSIQRYDEGVRKKAWWIEVFKHIPVLVLGAFVGWVIVAVMQSLTNLILALA